jgi:Na+/phosphate symporter
MAASVTETAKLKAITRKLHDKMMEMATLCNYLDGYIRLSKGDVPIAAKDFGIAKLRKSINGKDAEGAMDALRQVKQNIKTYRAALAKQGLSDAMVQSVEDALTLIKDENQNQYRQKLKRTNVSTENLEALNALYETMQTVLHIGKVLYRKDKVKAREYTFAWLKKQVRIARKPVEG